MVVPQQKLHEDTASRFTREQYEEKNSLLHPPANTNQAPRAQNVTVHYEQFTRPAQTPRISYEPTATPSEGRRPAPAVNTNAAPTPTAASTAAQLRLRTKAVNTSIAIGSWTSFLWITLQLPLAVISLLSFAAAYAAESSNLLKIINALPVWTKELFGLTDIDFQALFFIPSVLILLVGFISFAGALLQYTLTGVHPLFGESGAGIKQGTAIGIFVLYAIPGLNFLPWVWLWLVAVARYPT